MPVAGTGAEWPRRLDDAACSGTVAVERTARGRCWPRPQRLQQTTVAGAGFAERPRTVRRTRYRRRRRRRGDGARDGGGGGRWSQRRLRRGVACAAAADTRAAGTCVEGDGDRPDCGAAWVAVTKTAAGRRDRPTPSPSRGGRPER